MEIKNKTMKTESGQFENSSFVARIIPSDNFRVFGSILGWTITNWRNISFAVDQLGFDRLQAPSFFHIP